MSILDNILQRWGYTKADYNPPEWLKATAAAEKFSIPSGEMWQSQADLYRRLSWVHIAVSTVAQACAAVPFSVMTYQNEETAEIINHPFEQLLRRPNPLQSRFEFLEATVAYRSLTGNAYWWLNKTTEEAEPAEMWIIPSYKIKPQPDENLFIDGYLYDPGDGTQIALETWEIVHFKQFHPLSPFVGLSPIEAIATISVGDLQMQDWNTRLFAENNARLPGILAFADPIPDSDWQKIKQDTIDASAKRQIMMLRNAGKGGVDWMRAAMSQKDMEFLAGRDFNKEEIFGIYAPGLASMLDVNATEANAKTGRATFSEYALWPILQSMSEKTTNNVLPLYGDNLIGAFEDIRFTDRSLELSEQQEFEKTHTIDEIRAEFYNDEPLGDERGEMLPAQIGAAPVSTEDDVPEMIPAPPLFTGAEPESDEVEQAVADDTKARAELKAWERFEVNQLGKEKRRVFKCYHVPEDIQARVNSAISGVDSDADIKRVFEIEHNGFSALVTSLVDATRALREVGE